MLLKRFCKEQKGHVLLQAMLIIPMLYLALFLPFGFSVAQHKRSVLNDVLDMALQKAAVEGGITAPVRQEIIETLRVRGFNPDVVTIEPGGYIQKLRGETISITISVPGSIDSLNGVKAIGGTPPPAGWRITASGSIMSEKIP
ncbi:MAG: hypothetical protein QHH10_10940 [Peptococcaceae bacterium]|jgi:hypothetical protein|nr:hypothetical protein [Peptococcaceae bacterium]MDH7525815.1 hypothetical protein [Peptococcaceae bacterium]